MRRVNRRVGVRKVGLGWMRRMRMSTPTPQCLSPTPNYTEEIHENLKIFDRLFSEFEFSYVSCMVRYHSTAIPWCTISYTTSHNHTIPYHNIPYYTIPHYTTPYHTT